MKLYTLVFPLLSVIVLLSSALRAGESFSWQQPHAEVLEQGDLKWAPRPFVFQKGASVRYIDFDGGDDANDGTSQDKPWKHHPWDAAATGKAKACKGIHTYIFKGGVYYRGELKVAEAGKPGDPIRLTRDPAWGTGEAVLCGSEKVSAWKKGAEHKDIPEPDKVWQADLDFTPRSVWLVRKEGDYFRIPLARTPNWKRSNPDDVKSEWWVWDNPKKPFGNTIKNAAGKDVHLGIDTKHIKDKPAEYFSGALIWPEYGWVMSGPYPTQVEVVDLKQNGLGFAGWTGGGAGGVIMKNMRYYLEDKPHYLDDADGEYWFEKKGNGGRLYLRLAGDADPNTLRIEAGKRPNLVNGENVEHVHISGLTFRFTTAPWDITASTWDFSTKPWGFRSGAHPGCVRVWGAGRDIRVANCLFEHVCLPIRIKALAEGQQVDDVLIEDNDFRFTDNGIMAIGDGSGWGHARMRGRLGHVRIFRNHSFETGTRPSRFSIGTGIQVSCARTVEIAGNVIERSYAQGIDVVGTKINGMLGDAPFTRILIHHNKVWESMLNCNDFGGIETWQGGPAYVFNNLSYHALGYRNWGRYTGTDAGFGHLYYLDGAFKNFHFNNIAWGKAKDVANPAVNCSAFQEIISYQNTFFQNTIYNVNTGSRRQEPSAGRNKYLGNIWQGIGKHVFRHADPAKTAADANAKDAGAQKEHFALETNAYGRNFFNDVAELGVLEPSGRWLLTFDDFKSALEKHKSLLSDLGEVSKAPLLKDPAKGNFAPAENSPALGKGVKVFVPWALSGVVGEWHFYGTGGDAASILDEHWYMTDYHVSREHYHQRPTYPLKGVNIGASDYAAGTLEDWIAGALTFSAAKKQFATLTNTEMMKPFSFTDYKKSRHENAKPEPSTIEGEALKNPQIYTSNMLIEIVFKTAPGHGGSVLIEKMKESGYSLSLSSAGKLSFSVKGPGTAAAVESQTAVNDGQWHHAIVEADRKAKVLTVYIDGKKDASASGIDGTVSLANDGDLVVGGTATGRHLDGAIDFLRIAHGTLADADTTIEELYTWEFNGPQFRDFRGKPAPAARDAGAIGR
ncbi:MAG TPA: LamG-like jellyroll fold domain-containing protein [Planctomycetota bacterium]|nr:LamG-like jellyroll fold domain-containing protein [Planctomycetota bacterium]